MQVRNFWAKVSEKANELRESAKDGSIHVTSLENLDRATYAGQTFHVTVENAAKLIVSATHRLATKQEIAAYESRHEEARKKAAADQLKKQPVVNLGPEAALALAGARSNPNPASK